LFSCQKKQQPTGSKEDDLEIPQILILGFPPEGKKNDDGYSIDRSAALEYCNCIETDECSFEFGEEGGRVFCHRIQRTEWLIVFNMLPWTRVEDLCCDCPLRSLRKGVDIRKFLRVGGVNGKTIVSSDPYVLDQFQSRFSVLEMLARKVLPG